MDTEVAVVTVDTVLQDGRVWEASVQYICGVFKLSSESTSSVAVTVADRLSAPGMEKMKNRGIYTGGGIACHVMYVCLV